MNIDGKVMQEKSEIIRSNALDVNNCIENIRVALEGIKEEINKQIANGIDAKDKLLAFIKPEKDCEYLPKGTDIHLMYGSMGLDLGEIFIERSKTAVGRSL